VLRTTHLIHVSNLSVESETLSARLCLPVAFQLAAFASWIIPFPLKYSAFLAVGLLEESATRLHRDYHVPHLRARTGEGVFSTAGAWCPIALFVWPRRLSRATLNPWTCSNITDSADCGDQR